MADYKDFIPEPSVMAAAAGSLAAAVKRRGQSVRQRIATFFVGFAACIFLAPYILEKLGVTSQAGSVAFGFSVAYLSDVILTPALAYLEQATPALLDKWLKRKLDIENKGE